jgi:hypothetical protein
VRRTTGNGAAAARNLSNARRCALCIQRSSPTSGIKTLMALLFVCTLKRLIMAANVASL